MAPKWRRTLFWGVIGAVLLGGLAIAFRPQTVDVDLAVIAAGPMTVTVDQEGVARIREVFVVSAPVTGLMMRITAEAGDPVVAESTILARIEPVDPAFLDLRTEGQARAAVSAAEAALALSEAHMREAEAELAFARAERSRAEQLLSRRTISQQAADTKERAFKIAEAAVESARAERDMRGFELSRARAVLVTPAEAHLHRDGCACVSVTAPVSGAVLRVLHESEGVVQTGTPLLEVGDLADLEIVADYLSTDAVRIAPGQRVILTYWGGDVTLNGKVRRVEPFGFTKVSALGVEEQRVNVVIDLTDDHAQWARLSHGFRVEAQTVLWERDDVVQTPATALFRGDDGGWSVFVEEDGTARQRRVEIGRRNAVAAEVLSGLSVGEAVVLHPSDRVEVGIRIRQRLYD